MTGSSPPTAAPPLIPANKPLFARMVIVGIGLIGSSLARAVKLHGLTDQLVLVDADPAARARSEELALGDEVTGDVTAAVAGADIFVLAVPMRAFPSVLNACAPALPDRCIVTDTGSTKESALRDMVTHLGGPERLVPGHPVSGTEHSGADAGFASLFEGRWCILTPTPQADPALVDQVTALWTHCGSRVERMSAAHHDRVLAITSHVPHLIAFTIVSTAQDLETATENEVIKYSAGGFRDFTRIAASDPTMWRDVFLSNQEAVLEILQRFSEDIALMQRAIRWGEADTLEQCFRRTRAIRRRVIEQQQA
jgi:cyclohexadieny/prephenate dehydrogenase